jgi:hypothetical protein
VHLTTLPTGPPDENSMPNQKPVVYFKLRPPQAATVSPSHVVECSGSAQRREIPATAPIPCHISVMLHRLPLALKSFLCRPAAPVISRCRREFSLSRAKADFTVSRRCAAPHPIQPRFSSRLMRSLKLGSGRRCRARGARDRGTSGSTCSADSCSRFQQEQFRVVHIRPVQRRPA